MSFRKRGEVLNNGRGGPGAVPGRTVPGRTPAGMANSNRTLPNRGPMSTPQQSRTLTGRMQNMRVSDGTTSGAPITQNETATVNDEQNGLLLNHPGIRPSPLSGTFVTSTGCEDLDKVLTHMGLPLGHSMLVEEEGTTEFNSILAKIFAAQGIVYNRVTGATKITGGGDNGNTHLIVLSFYQMFAKELPGVYKGSKKDIKKSKISEEQSKLSVQNLTEKQSTPSRYKDFKIAWKYKLADEEKEKLNAKKSTNTQELNDDYKDYNHQFDITSRIMPAPSNSEISFISPNLPISTILTQVEQIIKRQKNKLIRIIIPSFLHPAMYQPDFFSLSKSISLIHGLRSIVKVHEDRCVLFATVSTDILSKLLRIQLENLFDAVIDLEPFPQDMLQFLERIYKSQPNKVQHGLLHVLKLPIFSERGEMQVKKSEWAFRNGRKRFEVDEWSIPVDDVESSSNAKQPGSDDHSHGNENETSHNHSNSSATAPKNTKISLEY
ncbi:similar to Saccharomyces cerevisiae YPL101W ELP4 Subunit of Elongator complex, which is required for modification of wobble nucleosides in tRNA [Maudiozyma saulgeensis]|uniref:Elongator complex protein 4 n=1 Tax=Maudiozyma saulgeensis TaxID=1789683 RepID=A0A1X7R6C9_9SACH|nr:similar to Saccharomyces cerevisiae YPL101W ELP4 Subunit of Elongator complex, which is required for modification of wobble nucleosides in tRNA [Kazachstania saulgeensis]